MQDVQARAVEQRQVRSVTVTVVELPSVGRWLVVLFDRFGVKTERRAFRKPGERHLETLVAQHVRFSMTRTRRN